MRPAKEADMTTRSISLKEGYRPQTVARALLGTAARLWRAWVARRQVMGLLEADSRMLADIGLSRSDVIGSLEVPYDMDPSHHLIRTRAERMSARVRRRHE
jgi:uncharacterized protein YjiS (DUF1127 family)